MQKISWHNVRGATPEELQEEEKKALERYGSIINLPHPISKKHPRMPLWERAAQFSPFDALTGYSDAVKETARQTDSKRELTEDEKEQVNEKLQILYESLQRGEPAAAKIEYFEPDLKKEGGAYLTVQGKILKFDLYRRKITMEGDRKIPIDQIQEISLTQENGD